MSAVGAVAGGTYMAPSSIGHGYICAMGGKLTPCFPQQCMCSFPLSSFQKLQAELFYLCVCPSIQLFSPQQMLLRSHC